MKIKNLILIIAFLIPIICNSQGKNSVLTNSDEFTINKSAFYFINSNLNNDLSKSKKISYFDFIKIKKYPIKTKAIWLKLNLENLKHDSLFIYTKQSIPKLELYTIKNKKLQLIDKTGYANRISNNSVTENSRTIKFYNTPNLY